MYLTLCDPMDCPWNSPDRNTGVGSLSFLQGIFPTQGLNPGVPHCRWILYQLSHQGSPWGMGVRVGDGCSLSPEPLPPRFELSLQTVLSPSQTPGLPRFFLIPLSPLTPQTRPPISEEDMRWIFFSRECEDLIQSLASI